MIPYGRQKISRKDISEVTRVLNSEYLTTGPEVSRFESELEKWNGGIPTVAVSSGTAALHVAYKAAGIEPGDEIITTPMTFIATQATAALLGAKIVFADIQPDTANLDPLKVISRITTKTKAIVAVDYAGHPADMDELRIICDDHKLLLIEDAAHSLGSTYRGKPVGSLADITTFSFFPTKNIATGEGGAVSSKEPEIIEKAKLFSRQGIIRDKDSLVYPDEGPWHQEVHDFGLNYRMPDILATLGTSQLQQLNKFKKSRNEVFHFYNELFSNIEEVTIPTVRDYVDPIWHLYPIRVPSSKRKKVFESFHNHGIKVQVNYFPAHLHPVFKDEFPRGSFPISEEFYDTEISLPMSASFSKLELEEIRKVCFKIFLKS